jgi:hypothetical protein
MAKKVIIGVVGVVVLAVGWYFFQLQREAAKWQQVKEIDDEVSFYEKDGANSKMRFVSVIDAPLDKVQSALWQVERSAEIVDNISRSKLIKQEGNTKLLEMHVQPLNLPLQYYTMEFTFVPDKHRVEFKTVDSNTQDISGSYQLEASPDGTRTKLIYEASGKDKVAVPVPESVIESASRQTFVNTVRGITKVAKSG